MKSFNKAAESYDKHSFIQQQMAEWLSEWLPENRSGSAIETGAGTGIFTEKLLPWNGILTASDAAPSMVSIGQKRLPNPKWIIASAENLPGSSFNWIFSSSFLQWAQNPARLLRYWKSLLAPDGKILAGLFTSPTLPELESLLPGHAPLQWHSPETWKNFFLAAGLQIKRAEERKMVFHFPSAIDLLRNLHRTGTAPKHRFSAATLRSAIREYDRRFANSDGSVLSTWYFFRIETAPATKPPP